MNLTQRDLCSMTAGNRIDDKFVALRRERRKALVPYLTAGFPSPEWTLAILELLADQGADIIELGVPFSDPIADGPTIQAACKVALDNGTTLPWVLETLERFRSRHDVPVVLFGAMNPFHRYGLDRFAADARRAGADGVLIPDVPLEETPFVRPALEAQGLHLIELIAPTTPLERKKRIVEQASGFLYYISLKGVTGARGGMHLAVEEPIAELRALTSLPVVVGFGIATAEQAAQVSRVADGIVVGSALIDKLASCSSLQEALKLVGPWVSQFREAIDRS